MEEHRKEKPKPSVAKLAYTIPEVAAALGISEKQVDNLIADDKIGSIKIERSRRVTSRQLDDYLRSLEAKSGWKPAA